MLLILVIAAFIQSVLMIGSISTFVIKGVEMLKTRRARSINGGTYCDKEATKSLSAIVEFAVINCVLTFIWVAIMFVYVVFFM